MSNGITLKKHRITVLLIDDQLMIGETIRRMLMTEEDIDFHYCQDPIKAIKTANKISPTVILQDLIMPEIDGLTLVKYIRANPNTKEVPLIVLSSKEEPVIKAEAFALGANDYMVKFPDKLEVIARIRYHSKGYINLLERNEAFLQLERANRFIRKTFGRYLSDEIVDTILESPDGMQLGGEKRTLTIMMTDLRGFTAIGERLPAENVVKIINLFLESMTEIVLKYQGTIDEFIGDAILAIFGAPILREDDAKRSVACALEMQIAMKEVNRKNVEKGFPEIAMGIGINTGDVVVGNIGSSKRTKYGVVGRNVNLTSRIESYTTGGQILISETTKAACGNVLRIDDQMEVMPKGVIKPIMIYEIGGIADIYNIYLPKKNKTDLKLLSKPLFIKFRILDGKHAGTDLYEGEIVKMSENIAKLDTNIVVDKLINIKISLFDGENKEITNELYAKIIEVISESPPQLRVNFTSVPPQADNFFKFLHV
ncbi:MAG: response regulator [Desulfobacterales bacterium]|nr:response regulator [Desulfobacterales bacterium]